MRLARAAFGNTARWINLKNRSIRVFNRSPFDELQPTDPIPMPDDLRLLAPVEPSKIFCLGRNYAEHRAEMGYTHDGAPSVFMKPPSSVIGPNEHIMLPPARLSTHVEHEAELAVVIGRRARNVPASEASHYILGYTCANDVSARDLQRSDPHPTRGKGFDTFCPVGPWIETDLDIAVGARLTCHVNDQLRQDVSTSEMTYDIPFLIEYLTAFTTLHPGDLILTGSPGGTTKLNPGDRITVNIAGIGTLTNDVSATHHDDADPTD